MITQRLPEDDFGITRIVMYPNELQQQARMGHQVTCADFDYDEETDQRIPPTVRISLLGTYKPSVEDVRRLAREYDYVADVAAALEVEKRAAYEARFATLLGEHAE